MEKEVQNNKKTKKTLISRLITYIFGGFIALLLIFQISGSISAQSNYGVPSFFGYQTLIVLTDSMEPEVKVDDAIIVKKVDLSTIMASTTIEAKDGDVITFFRRADGLVVTHRVIDVTFENNQYYFKALGDNLNAQTCPTGGCNPDIHYDIVEGRDVLGVMVGKSPFFGQVVSVSTNPLVIAGVAIIPLFYVFISSVADIVKHSKMKPGEFEPETISDFEEIKRQEKLKLLIELEKEKLRAELLAEQNKVTEDDKDGQTKNQE